MRPVEIARDVYWVGVNDRTTGLFEGLWPIGDVGVSYNSYLINDTKKVLVDLAKALKSDDYFAQVAAITDPATIDYVVINHMEPDHTGILRLLRRVAPGAKIVCSEKCKPMLRDFYGIENDILVVADGDMLDLGTHRLRFVSTPFVHWPETMMSFEETTGVLFSCDGFGGYGALEGPLFDDECRDRALYEREALRYFVNIVAKFHVSTAKAITKLESVPVALVAPSHGLVWRGDPQRIIELYRTWCAWGKSGGLPGVTIVYGSMYGNTESIMNAVAQGVAREGVPVQIFDCAATHVSYVLPSLWSYKGVLIGAPTYEGGLFPPAAAVMQTVIHKSVRNKIAGYFGSYGWSGGALRETKELAAKLDWHLEHTFEFPGGPTPADFEKAVAFGADFATAVKAGTP